MNIGIIGCGYIGKKRAKTLKGHNLLMVCDKDRSKAQHFDKKTPWTDDYKDVINNENIEIVIISTTNDFLVPIALYAAEKNKHILIEKPAAKSASELKVLMDFVKDRNIKIKVGFNLRYHPGLLIAKMIVDSGKLGELMFLRGRYGHGGRLGYEKEWRSDVKISGGGELIDQGVHLIDLSRWFLGEFKETSGSTHTYFWDMKVDDNSFISLQTEKGQKAWLHVSCTEWKNMFSLEIYGKKGKIQIDGLGGSYGKEKVMHYQMLPDMKPPLSTLWEFDKDDSWQKEFDSFVGLIEKNLPVLNESLNDAYEALKIVDEVYKK